MINPAFVVTMARYNIWQNKSLLEAADQLDDAARKADRGAFFGSIHGTFSHLLWGDRMWMSRLAGHPPPSAGSIGESASMIEDWTTLKEERNATDVAIAEWAESLQETDLDEDLTWFSGATGAEVTKPVALLVTHMFNHQTHHRGQIHAMLTAAGVRPGATDLFIMPD